MNENNKGLFENKDPSCLVFKTLEGISDHSFCCLCNKSIRSSMGLSEIWDSHDSKPGVLQKKTMNFPLPQLTSWQFGI